VWKQNGIDAIRPTHVIIAVKVLQSKQNFLLRLWAESLIEKGAAIGLSPIATNHTRFPSKLRQILGEHGCPRSSRSDVRRVIRSQHQYAFCVALFQSETPLNNDNLKN
jgi:hypothetical protein